MGKERKSLRLSVIALVLFAYFSGVLPGPPGETHAQPAKRSVSKLSDDLISAINTAATPGMMIPVVFQIQGKPSTGFLSSVNMSGGSGHKYYANIPALAVKLPAAIIALLATRVDVVHISLDRPTHLTGHLETTTGAAQARAYGTSSGGIDGSGIGIAILDSGIYTYHHSFNSYNGSYLLGNRVAASVDFTGEGRTDDPYGHGTHVAAIAAGNSHVANGAYTGIAPAAKILNVRVLDSNGQGSTSAALQGIDWCITNKAAYNIRVMNMSFGSTAVDSYANDPMCLAVRQAVAAGIVVCAAAGNSGKDAYGNKIFGAIHSPGIEPSAITVGAVNTFGTDTRSDDGIASYSSRGPTRGYTVDSTGVRTYDNIIKPDLVAPGNKIVEAESFQDKLVSMNPALDANITNFVPHKMMYLSGTSMATPAVAGAAALILQKNPALTPNLVKAVLEYTAQRLAGFNTLEQGAGELNAEGAVRLAGLIRQDLTGRSVGDPLLSGLPPTESTTISGFTFLWAGGLLEKWNALTGQALITKYQGIYGTSTLLTDGVLLTNGVLLGDGTLLGEGVLLGDGVILADGTVLASGTVVVLGVNLADGVYLADGVILADGSLLSDCILASSPQAPSPQTAANGDPTAGMIPTVDTSLGD